MQKINVLFYLKRSYTSTNYKLNFIYCVYLKLDFRLNEWVSYFFWKILNGSFLEIQRFLRSLRDFVRHRHRPVATDTDQNMPAPTGTKRHRPAKGRSRPAPTGTRKPATSSTKLVIYNVKNYIPNNLIS